MAILFTTSHTVRYERVQTGDSFPTTTFTLCLWFNAGTAGTARPIVGFSDTATFILATSTSNVAQLNIAGSIIVDAGGTLTAGVWKYLVLTRTAGTNTYEIFLGDESTGVASQDSGVSATAPTGGKLAISADLWNGGGSNGAIAWPRIWSSVLSTAEMDAERVSTTPVKAGAYSSYDFTDTTTAPTDLSGNARTLTVQGSPTNTTNPSAGAGATPINVTPPADSLAGGEII